MAYSPMRLRQDHLSGFICECHAFGNRDFDVLEVYSYSSRLLIGGKLQFHVT